VAPQKLSDLLPLLRAARQNGVFIAARCAASLFHRLGSAHPIRPASFCFGTVQRKTQGAD